MTTGSLSIIGSGTKIPATAVIIPSGERGTGDNSVRKERYGQNVVVINAEDITSVETFAASGITIGTTPIKIWGTEQSFLPRARTLKIENSTDSSTVFIAHDPSKVISEGWALTNAGANTPRSSVELPVLTSVEVYAATSTGTASIRMLIF